MNILNSVHASAHVILANFGIAKDIFLGGTAMTQLPTRLQM